MLIYDGSNNAGFIHPLVAAFVARQQGIMINTIVVGSEGEVLSPIAKRRDSSYKYALSESVLDTSSLQKTARMTAGNFQLIANTADQNIDFNEIMNLAKASPVLTESFISETIDKQANHNIELWLREFELEELLIHH